MTGRASMVITPDVQWLSSEKLAMASSVSIISISGKMELLQSLARLVQQFLKKVSVLRGILTKIAHLDGISNILLCKITIIYVHTYFIVSFVDLGLLGLVLSSNRCYIPYIVSGCDTKQESNSLDKKTNPIFLLYRRPIILPLGYKLCLSLRVVCCPNFHHSPMTLPTLWRWH